MKKKIKDLTLAEISKICCSNSCVECPLWLDKKNLWCCAEFAGMDVEKSFPNEIEKETEVKS